MQHIKSFYIKSEPTGKLNRELSSAVDRVVNEWFAGMGSSIKNVRISHSAETKMSFPEAFVIVTYETDDEDPPTYVELETKAEIAEVIPGSEVPAESEGKKPQRFGKKK